MEHSKNSFAPEAAVADAADEALPRPSATPSNLPATLEGGEPDVLAFDPVAMAPRLDGWTPERQRAFIEELADCGIVGEAAARVGMTDRSARRLRRRPDAQAFSLAWEAALRLGVEHLCSIAYERAVLGIVKPRFYRGEKIGEERVYDNRLLVSLLGRQPEHSTRHLTDRVIGDWDRWMKAIEDGIEEPSPLPDKDDGPVWQQDDGHWWTSFPPPSDFDGKCRGEYGEEDYARACTAEECARIAAWFALDEADGRRERDAYFARLK